MINLSQLNNNQREAVTTSSKYVRIIAGAGSGKTRVLVTRIAYLISERNIFSNKILAITFTNKAANEMKERIKNIVGSDNACFISTIHSLCVRILREDIVTLNYPRNFTVMDTSDQRQILKEAYKELDLDVQSYSYASMLDYISNNKNAGIGYERSIDMAGGFKGEKERAEVYRYYVLRQVALYALDFDDLLLKTVEMFKKFPEVLDKWMKRFSHIHVDEFQDIDKVQYELIRLLAGYDNELYVVGDPDQTIYTWRGADVDIIMNFEKDFKPCHTIILNENYRSTTNILNGANSVIKNNKFRIDKDLYSNKKNEEKISYYSSPSEEYEAKWIASKIKEGLKNKKSYRDFAILYRSNYLSRSIEKGLLEEKIPYVIYGGVKFYDRAEIKDILSYIRLVLNEDDLSFNRIINVPKRGLGPKTLDTILLKAKEDGTSMYEVIKNKRIFSNKIQNELDRFVNLIETLKKDKDTLETDKFIERVIDLTGYRRMLENDHEIERIENIKSLIGDVKTFMVDYPESDLNDYLQLVSLYGDKEEENEVDYVSLMTVHASKGLEFDTVFVCGMSDGIFPSERSLSDGIKGVEEERRIAYVAFTRAKNKLYLTDSSGFSYVLSKARVTSRFIDEIEEDYIENLNEKNKKPEIVRQVYSQQTSEAGASKSARYRKGDMVNHKMFGEGIIVNIKGAILEIAFKFPHGIKKIAANHASLEKVNKLRS